MWQYSLGRENNARRPQADDDSFDTPTIYLLICMRLSQGFSFVPSNVTIWLGNILSVVDICKNNGEGHIALMYSVLTLPESNKIRINMVYDI